MPALSRRKGARTAPRRARHRVTPRAVRLGLRLGTPALALLIAAGGGAWLALSGTGEALAVSARETGLRITARLGLAVEHVLVRGRRRADRAEVAAALGARRGMPILDLDPFAAKRRLEALAWVRAATVERRLPDTVYVRLVEREPLALWQHRGRLALIDRRGGVITRARLGRYRSLPLVVGAGAPDHAAALLEILEARPEVRDRVAAAVRVGDRRWDLKLDGGVVVRLPEEGAARALATLAELVVRDRILARDVVAIDMRLPDRLVVRTAPDGRREEGENPAPRRPAKDT